ncbi:MAG TPA: hypothetical protein VF785_04570 [Gemmatimonadaceae bacterium]|jgi:hypothetical protein
MSDPSSSNLPAARLDRASLERVLARAAELQSTSGDTVEEFTEEQLLDLGKEVGLSPQNLRQALAEERTRSVAPEEEHGITSGIFGPSRVGAARTVPGTPAEVLASIDAWMQRQELLIVKRHHADRIVWESRRDFVVGVKRALRVGGRDYALSRAFEVSATVIAVDDSRVHVGLDADFRSHRAQSARQALGTSLVGAAATASLVIMGVAAVVAVAPVIIGPAIGIAGARALQSRIVTRAQLALEQLLDRLERGEFRNRTTDSLLGAIVAAATAIPPRRF